jgi:tetratricopeptide (TPR) repeat protein
MQLLPRVLFALIVAASPLLASDAEMRAAFQRGNQLKESGKIDEAEKEYKRSLDLALELYGEENQTTAVVLNALARLYHDARRFEEAARIHARSLKVRQKIAPGSLDEAIGHSGLGLALQELDRNEEAEKHLASALRLRETGKDQIAIAQDATNLGTLYRTLGRYAEAEELQLKALGILTARLPGHQFTAMVLNNLANLYLEQGKYADADGLYRKALSDLRKAHGPDHPLVGSALHNLGLISRRRGNYDEAERLGREALAIFEKMPGNPAIPVADAWTHLGNLYYEQSRFADAESAHRRALKLREDNLPSGHLLIAASLNNVAAVRSARGQLTDARDLYRRALKMREDVLPAGHPSIAESLNNLAAVAQKLGEDTEAEELYRRVVEMREKVPGPKHPQYAEAVFNLANVHQKAGRTREAELGYRNALDLLKKALGEDHPKVADALHELARLQLVELKTDAARALFARENEIATRALGANHPSAARSKAFLALLAWWEGNPADAVALFSEQRKADRRFLLQELPLLPDSEQRSFLSHEEGDRAWCAALSLARQHSDDPQIAARSAEWVLNGKAVALEARSLRLRLDRDLTDQGAKRDLAAVRDLLAREAALALRESGPGAAAVRAQREKLRASRRELERRLVAAGGPVSGLTRPWVTLESVRAAMPKNGLLVEIVQFQPIHLKPKDKIGSRGEPRYTAWVFPTAGTVKILDLGPAAEVDRLVGEARRVIARGPQRIRELGEVAAEKEVREVLSKIAERIFHPLAPFLKGVDEVIISPDGELWLAPWAALPLDQGNYLVEGLTLRLVISGRDLLGPAGPKNDPGGQSVILADPDFDAAPSNASLAGRELSGKLADFDVIFAFGLDGKLVVRLPNGDVIGRGTWRQDGDQVIMETERSTYSGRLTTRAIIGERRIKGMADAVPDAFQLTVPPTTVAASRTPLPERVPRAGRLLGTKTEGEAAAKALDKVSTTRLLTAVNATESAVKAAHRPTALVLATHGYFLADPHGPVLLPTGAIRGGLEPVSPRKPPIPSAEPSEVVLRSGLLLAGCNKRAEVGAGQEDGVLTALEILGLDLGGTRLVVLSACETGVGKATLGDGYAGLRQAFQLAGARSVVATLWKIPDAETVTLMERFYSAWAESKDGATALATAQRDIIERRRKSGGAAHPFYWAAFGVTGR